MEISDKQLDKLIVGFPPQLVNREWDYETVIVELAKLVKRYRRIAELTADYIIKKESEEQ
jgi:hypothetical protein